MVAAFFLAFFLHTAEIELAGKTVTVEIADTPQTRDRGLMGRSSLAPDHGMLFVYEKPQLLSFWMKNTLIPLSIAFFDQEQILLNVEEMVPSDASSLPIYESRAPALYALEMPSGWFDQNKIRPGTKFTFHE